MCGVPGLVTFSCVVGQDGTRPHLLALRVLSRTGVGTLRPRCPGAQSTVLRTWHLADHGHGQDGITAQLPFHKFTCTNIDMSTNQS